MQGRSLLLPTYLYQTRLAVYFCLRLRYRCPSVPNTTACLPHPLFTDDVVGLGRDWREVAVSLPTDRHLGPLPAHTTQETSLDEQRITTSLRALPWHAARRAQLDTYARIPAEQSAVRHAAVLIVATRGVNSGNAAAATVGGVKRRGALRTAPFAWVAARVARGICLS